MVTKILYYMIGECFDFVEYKEISMAGNASLNKAAQAKQDEFYTQLADIENELRHYKDHFKGKTVFCNCDDPYESNFFKYFAMNFNYLGLKKLITTCYVSSPVVYTQLALFEDMQQTFEKSSNPNKKPYKVEITEVSDQNGDGAFDLEDIKHLLKNKNNVCTVLEGDGDFRSNECIELLKQADIVVTNPPFSLLREYVAQLIQYEKSFLIIGNQNATHYKEVFPLIKDNKIWLGYNHVKEFLKPDGSTQKFGNVIWFTNLDITKRHESFIFCRQFNEDDYIHYLNFDGIDVSRIVDIPDKYFGYMGVPDSFLETYNPDEFEICGLSTGDTAKEIGVEKNYRGRTDLSYMKDGKPSCPYSRIVIRRRNYNNGSK